VERFLGQGAHGKHCENDSDNESDTIVFGDQETYFAMDKGLFILNLVFCASCRSLLLLMPSLRPIGGEKIRYVSQLSLASYFPCPDIVFSSYYMKVTSALTRHFTPPKYCSRQVLFPNHAGLVLHVRPSRWAGNWAARADLSGVILGVFVMRCYEK
jgi:hypothetical protein